MIKSVQKPSYDFPGIYRGLVENNVDPEDAGQIQVRIMGIHDFNGEITPIEQLPWAKPAAGLYNSGGHNITNKDHEYDTPDVPGKRYDPGAKAKIPIPTQNSSPKISAFNDRSSDFKDTVQDDFSNDCGTGGQLVVPKRGNWVFLFFEAGNHMNPYYFAMAPMKRDWDTQKKKRSSEITEKIVQIGYFRKTFKPRHISIPQDLTSWAKAAVVNSKVDVPNLDISPVDGENRDIYCMTSAKGTSVIIDNRFDKERMYIIHKNFIDHTDENGNKKIYVGKSHGASTDSALPTNYELGVEGKHELFIGGDYLLYPKGNIYIQTDKNYQLDVSDNVGIVVRNGDVDLIVEKGNANIDIAGDADVNVGKNLNAKINGNANALIAKDLKATILGGADIIVTKDAKLSVVGNLSATIAGNTKMFSAGGYEFTGGDVKIASNLHVSGNIRCSGTAQVGSNLSVGGVAYVMTGINCGGFIWNRGPVNIGSPCVIHGLVVVGGFGTGTGVPPVPPQTVTGLPTVPTPAIPTYSGVTIKKELLLPPATKHEIVPA